MNVRSKTRQWALPVSVACNIFLCAVIGVHQWHHMGHPPGPPSPQHMADELARLLSEADGKVLREAFASEPELQRDRWRMEWDNMEQIRKALRADPFDPGALEAAFRQGHAGRDAADQALGRVLLKAASAMSSDGRHRLADHRGPPGPPPPD